MVNYLILEDSPLDTLTNFETNEHTDGKGITYTEGNISVAFSASSDDVVSFISNDVPSSLGSIYESWDQILESFAKTQNEDFSANMVWKIDGKRALEVDFDSVLAAEDFLDKVSKEDLNPGETSTGTVAKLYTADQMLSIEMQFDTAYDSAAVEDAVDLIFYDDTVHIDILPEPLKPSAATSRSGGKFTTKENINGYSTTR